MLLTVKRVIPRVYEIYYKGQNIITLIRPKPNDWRFSGFFMKEQDKVNDLLLANVFGLSFRTKRQALIELEAIFARFESLLAESIS
jgi:hypothetical protein|nr:MAG TPA: hypothetical protein [Caudoviricetes sp.]